MKDAPIPNAEPNSALAQALSDLVLAVDTDLADLRDVRTEVAEPSDGWNELPRWAKESSPASRALPLLEIAHSCGLVNVQRAAPRVYELHRESEGANS